MTVSELKRWLKKQGCIFEEGTKHTKVVFGAKVTRSVAELKTKTFEDVRHKWSRMQLGSILTPKLAASW